MQTAARILFYLMGSSIISYVTPRFLIALGVPLDTWIVAAASTARLKLSGDSAKWGMSWILGMVLLGGTILYFPPLPLSPEKNITDVIATPYQAQLTDDVLNILQVPSEILLPTNLPRGKSIVVKDGTDNAVNSHIKIEVMGGGKISGMPWVEIGTNRGAWSFIWDGKEWSVY